MKKPPNTSITLSGQVFVDKLLAHELPGRALPRQLSEGDVKVICVPKGHGYAGFLRAYIFQRGYGWRNLALREEAAVDAIYHGPVERVARAVDCIEHLRSLKGMTATWGDRAYVVKAAKPPAMLALLSQGNMSGSMRRRLWVQLELFD